MKQVAFQKAKFLSFSASGAILLLLSACADLKGIRQFSEVSADTASYTALSIDHVKSFERQKRFQDQSRHADLDRKIKDRKQQQDALLGLHRGVQEYMTAIGALAADELVSYDSALDSFSKNLKSAKMPHLNDKSVDAFSALIKLIAKAASDAYRQKQLNLIIGDSNTDFQTLISSMSDIVGLYYISSLEDEEAAVDKFYQKIIVIADNAPPPQQASIQLLKESWQAKKDAIAVKKQSCALYAKSLKKIGEGHQLLYQNREKLTAKQFLDTLYGYRKEVEALNKEIQNIS
ncbi:MAG TPA: hypothetical protein PK000_04245 [Candidatus Saccharibacteria bacterium]|nr:hypothetical protein [Candidatus Saccharibacteria bacterium]